MNIRVARGQKECLSQGALSDDTEWTALPNLVQLHFSTNLLILWNYREGGSNTLVKGSNDKRLALIFRRKKLLHALLFD